MKALCSSSTWLFGNAYERELLLARRKAEQEAAKKFLKFLFTGQPMLEYAMGVPGHVAPAIKDIQAQVLEQGAGDALEIEGVGRRQGAAEQDVAQRDGGGVEQRADGWHRDVRADEDGEHGGEVARAEEAERVGAAHEVLAIELVPALARELRQVRLGVGVRRCGELVVVRIDAGVVERHDRHRH